MDLLTTCIESYNTLSADFWPNMLSELVCQVHSPVYLWLEGICFSERFRNSKVILGLELILVVRSHQKCIPLVAADP